MTSKIISVLTFVAVMQSGMCPSQPAPPDYSDLKFWAASPHKADASDQVPVFLNDEKRELLADVFFIHQTIYDKSFLDEHPRKCKTQD